MGSRTLTDGPSWLAGAPDGRSRESDAWVHGVIASAGLESALNIVALREPHRLRVVVEGRTACLVALDGERSEACGRAIATALLEHQDAAPRGWSVTVLARDPEAEAEVLVAEWHGRP